MFLFKMLEELIITDSLAHCSSKDGKMCGLKQYRDLTSSSVVSGFSR